MTFLQMRLRIFVSVLFSPPLFSRLVVAFVKYINFYFLVLFCRMFSILVFVFSFIVVSFSLRILDDRTIKAEYLLSSSGSN